MSGSFEVTKGSAMMFPGLCSVSFRNLSAAEVVALAKQAHLRGIEWGGDVHVPHGEVETAKAVRDLTLAAGLGVPSYGSYYVVSESEKQGLHFQSVLES